MMKRFILKNINTHTYLNYMKNIDFRHYTCDATEATRFCSRSECNKMLKKFKHPENWEIIGVELYGKR